MRRVDVPLVLLLGGKGEILEIVRGGLLALGGECLVNPVVSLGAHHHIHIVDIREGVLVLKGGVVRLVEVTGVGRGGRTGADPSGTGLVVLEVLVEGLVDILVIVPGGVHIESERTGELGAEALAQGELVVLVVADVLLGLVVLVTVGAGVAEERVAVLVLETHRRRRTHDTAEVVTVVTGSGSGEGARHVAVQGAHEVDRGVGGEPAVQVVAAVEQEGQPLVERADRQTVGVIVANGGVVTALVIAARHGHRIILGQRGIVDVVVRRVGTLVQDLGRPVHRVGHFRPAFLQEVGIRVRLPEDVPDGGIGDLRLAETVRIDSGEGGFVGPMGIVVGRTHPVDVVSGVAVLEGLVHEIEGSLGLEADLGRAHLAPLGRDQDNAVGGAGAVEGRRAGILQDVDGLDVIVVDLAHVIPELAVYDHQRRAAAVEVGTAAEDDGRRCRRVTGSLDDPETGNCTGQRRCRIGEGTDREGLLVHLGDGVGQLGTELGAAVTGDDHLVQDIVVIAENDRQGGAVPGHLDGLVTDGGNHEDVTDLGVGLDEVTVHVGHRTRRNGRILDQDGGRNDGLALCVFHRTLAGTVLGKEGTSAQQQDAEQRERCEQFL